MNRRLVPLVLCTLLFLSAGCSKQSPDDSAANPVLPEAEAQSGSVAVETVVESTEPGLGDGELDPSVKDVTVLVVGDSMAHSMGTGMANAVAEAAEAEGEPRNVTVVNAAMGGCGLMQPVMQPVDGKMQPTYEECNKWPETWASLVDEYNPDAVFLMSSFWDVAPQILEEGGEEVTIADPEVQEHWLAQADKAIAILSANGATVYLENGNSDGMHDVQARAAEANPQTTVLLNYRGEVCSDTECPAVIDGVKVLDDTGHPAGESQLRLGTWLLNQMIAQGSADSSGSSGD